MIDTTDPKAIELALTYCQGKSIINSINLEDGEEKFERICPHRESATARRWWWARSTKTSCRRRRSRASASWRWRSARCELLTEKYGIPPEDIIIDPLVFPCATGDANYIGGAVETIEAHPADQGEHSVREDGAGHFEHLVRAAGLGARSGELGLPVLLHQGRAGSGDRERGEAGALRFHSGRGAAAGGESAVQYARRPQNARSRPRIGGSRRRSRRPRSISSTSPRSPSTSASAGEAQESQGGRSAARSAPGELHHRRHQGRPDRRSRPQARRRRGAARHHQRPADGRHGRSRPAVQQQRADRGRSAAIGRSDEGRGQPSRAVHGEGRHGGARQDPAGHREGRRPRYRQEPGRDHPEQQRLQRWSIWASRCRPRS